MWSCVSGTPGGSRLPCCSHAGPPAYASVAPATTAAHAFLATAAAAVPVRECATGPVRDGICCGVARGGAGGMYRETHFNQDSERIHQYASPTTVYNGDVTNPLRITFRWHITRLAGARDGWERCDGEVSR